MFRPEIKDFSIVHIKDTEGNLIDTIGITDKGFKWIRYQWMNFGLFGVEQKLYPFPSWFNKNSKNIIYSKGLLKRIKLGEKRYENN